LYVKYKQQSLIVIFEAMDDTRLALAADQGQVDVVRRLVLEEGVDVNSTTTYGRRITPLFHAVARDRVDCVLFLLKHGANVGAVDHVGCNAVFDAVEFAAWDSLGLLVAAGADVNKRNESGDTPMSLALSLVRSGHRPVVPLLLAAGAKSESGCSKLNVTQSELTTGRQKLDNARAKLKGNGT
jgi:ankyrin repeat protein